MMTPGRARTAVVTTSITRDAEAVTAHLCHADGCTTPVPPRMFMCRLHWFSLPKAKRDAIWAAYVPGQERRMDPSPAYLDAAFDAVAWLADKERAS